MIFIRMIATKKGIAIGARRGGKFKTVLYVVTGFTALVFVCGSRISPAFMANIDVFKLAVFILSILSLVASYVSFADYLINFGYLLKNEKK